MDDKRKKYREENKEKIKQYRKEYYLKNKEKELLYQKKLIKKPLSDSEKEQNKLYRIEYRKNNKDKFKDSQKKWKENNKNHINEYYKKKRIEDPIFKLISNYRSMLYYRLKNKGYDKKTKSEIILGCSFDEFKTHIESLWESWMNWENYGNPKDGIYEENKTWDIDHIMPTSSAINETELIKLNHYTNLKPLCSYNNRFIKSNTIS